MRFYFTTALKQNNNSFNMIYTEFIIFALSAIFFQSDDDLICRINKLTVKLILFLDVHVRRFFYSSNAI